MAAGVGPASWRRRPRRRILLSPAAVTTFVLPTTPKIVLRSLESGSSDVIGLWGGILDGAVPACAGPPAPQQSGRRRAPRPARAGRADHLPGSLQPGRPRRGPLPSTSPAPRCVPSVSTRHHPWAAEVAPTPIWPTPFDRTRDGSSTTKCAIFGAHRGIKEKAGAWPRTHDEGVRADICVRKR